MQLAKTIIRSAANTPWASDADKVASCLTDRTQSLRERLDRASAAMLWIATAVTDQTVRRRVCDAWGKLLAVRTRTYSMPLSLTHRMPKRA